MKHINALGHETKTEYDKALGVLKKANGSQWIGEHGMELRRFRTIDDRKRVPMDRRRQSRARVKRSTAFGD